jgi:hypothetical protein
LFNNHPLAHSMPEAGVVHPIIRVGLGCTTATSGLSRLTDILRTGGHVSKVPRTDL